MIRRAGLADLPTLATLERELFGTSSYPYSVLRQIVDTWGSGLSVVTWDDAVIGYSLVVPSDEPLTAWMWSMGVHSAFRRRGVGRALLVHALRSARGAGIKRLLLTVDPANDIAVGLYRAFDFSAVAQTPDYFGPGEDRLVMECAL